MSCGSCEISASPGGSRRLESPVARSAVPAASACKFLPACIDVQRGGACWMLGRAGCCCPLNKDSAARQQGRDASREWRSGRSWAKVQAAACTGGGGMPSRWQACAARSLCRQWAVLRTALCSTCVHPDKQFILPLLGYAEPAAVCSTAVKILDHAVNLQHDISRESLLSTSVAHPLVVGRLARSLSTQRADSAAPCAVIVRRAPPVRDLTSCMCVIFQCLVLSRARLPLPSAGVQGWQERIICR